MSEVRVVELKELGVSKEVFDKIYSMGEQDGRADAIEEFADKVDSAILQDFYDEDVYKISDISKTIRQVAEQLKEQK